MCFSWLVGSDDGDGMRVLTDAMEVLYRRCRTVRINILPFCSADLSS